jgi:hypothetical protein
VNVVGIEGEGARGWVVDVVVGVAAEEDTRRFGIVGVREGRIGEGDGEEVEECGGEEDGWDYVSEGRLPPGGKDYAVALSRLARMLRLSR